MKNYLNYIKESNNSELDKLFLDLIHLNELEIRFNFFSIIKIDILYIYNDKFLCSYHKYNKYFCVDKSEIWLLFVYKYSHDEIEIIIIDMVEKYFKLNDINSSYDNLNKNALDIFK